ncbi:unnamed protein product [Clonostachys rosea]|uniref:DUF6594 domain-containing protein n=1 Tax=Bionectria ochroleuca TaxID=29856 RepID=A0ABY6URB2_BIOOC|nr:unnamed protein product [Clonostachys rosea]
MPSPSSDADLEKSTHAFGGSTSCTETRHSPTAYGLPNVNDGEVQPTEAEILEKPWKHIGYNGYSKIMASNSDLFILRRFSNLNVRIALALQDDVSFLEEELTALDEKYSVKTRENVHNGTLRDDIEDRKALLQQITKKLSIYNEFILQQAKLNQLDPAAERDIQSIVSWHWNHNDMAIVEEERKYLSHDDLVCPVPKAKTPLRRLLDKSERLRTLAMWRGKDAKPRGYDEKHLPYYSDKRMDRLTSAILLTAGVVMLITPMWILEAVDGIRVKLAVITAYVFVTLLMSSLTMSSKPFEALGATAV